MNKKNLALILIIFAISTLNADIFNFDKVIRNLKGKAGYKKDDYKKAEDSFGENALKYPNKGKMHFNLGNAQYKNGNLEEAENSYNLSLRDQDFPQRSKALQNLGNIKFDQKKYPDAIKYFRDALITDPSNAEARHNYEVTSRLLQKQQEQQQNQSQDKEQKDGDEKKDDKNQQKNEEQQQQEQQKQDEKSENEKQEQQELKKREDMKKEDAEKTIKALLQKEKEEMEKKKKRANPNEMKSGKYW